MDLNRLCIYIFYQLGIERPRAQVLSSKQEIVALGDFKSIEIHIYDHATYNSSKNEQYVEKKPH